MSDAAVGKIDQNGRRQLYLLERDLDQRIDQLGSAGRNPVDLFDPSKPDYVGSNKALSVYRTSLQQRMAERVAPRIAVFTDGAPSDRPKNIPPREPGETAEDYLRRTHPIAFKPSPILR
jgi:hypothetical protein